MALYPSQTKCSCEVITIYILYVKRKQRTIKCLTAETIKVLAEKKTLKYTCQNEGENYYWYKHIIIIKFQWLIVNHNITNRLLTEYGISENKDYDLERTHFKETLNIF